MPGVFWGKAVKLLARSLFWDYAGILISLFGWIMVEGFWSFSLLLIGGGYVIFIYIGIIEKCLDNPIGGIFSKLIYTSNFYIGIIILVSSFSFLYECLSFLNISVLSMKALFPENFDKHFFNVFKCCTLSIG